MASPSLSIGPAVGQRAPDIDLPDGNGQRWRLADQRGKVVVLLFYPGDETAVCTAQLCSVRDNWSSYQELGAEVVGINPESVQSHQRFAAHHQLPLRLLADPEERSVSAYGMRMPLVGKTRRGVVIIDGEGVIRFRKTVLPFLRPSDDDIIHEIKRLLS